MMFFSLQSSDKLHTRTSLENRSLHSPTHDSGGRSSPFSSRKNLSGRDLNNSHPPSRILGNTLREHMSDAESTGSKSAPVTPDGSPVAPRRSNRPHRTLDEDSSDDSFSERGNLFFRLPFYPSSNIKAAILKRVLALSRDS